MSNLRDCIRQLSIPQETADRLVGYMDEGMTGGEALRAHLNELNQTIGDIANKVQQAGGQVASTAPLQQKKIIEPRVPTPESQELTLLYGTVENKLQELLDSVGGDINALTSEVLADAKGAPKPRKGKAELDEMVAPRSVKDIREFLEWAIENDHDGSWYKQFSRGFVELVGKENMQEASILFGITSAQNWAEDNYADTLYIMSLARRINPVTQEQDFRKALKEPRPFEGNNRKLAINGDQIDNIVNMYQSGTYEGGLKVSSYMQVLRARGKNVFTPWSVQDVHMARVFGYLYRDVDKKSGQVVDKSQFPSDDAIRYGQWLTTLLAKEYDLTPDTTQAYLWFYGKTQLAPKKKKRKSGKRGDGTFESAERYSQPEIEEIRRMVREGQFDKNKALTQALDTGPLPKFDNKKVTMPFNNVDAVDELTELAESRGPRVIVSTKPGNARGYGFPEDTPLRRLDMYNKSVLEAITDDDGQIKMLRAMGIPHRVRLSYGSWEGVEPSWEIILPGESMKTAKMVATLMGDAMMQDAAVTAKPSWEGTNFGILVRKPDGSEFTSKELADLLAVINPTNNSEGLQFTATGDLTGVKLTDPQFYIKGEKAYSDKDYDKFAKSVTQLLGNNYTYDHFTQEGDYVDLERTGQEDRSEIWSEGGLTGRPDLQRVAVRDLYQPVWSVYREFRDYRFSFETEQAPVSPLGGIHRGGIPTRDGEADARWNRTSGLPIRPDGQVPLTHWGKGGLTSLNPDFYGSAAAGAEGARKDDPHWVNRTYYGLPGYQVESSVRSGAEARYFTTVSAQDLYDIAGDPLGLRHRAFNEGVSKSQVPTRMEELIQEAGYKGYWTMGRMPSVALFTSQTVESIPMGSDAAWDVKTVRIPKTELYQEDLPADVTPENLAPFDTSFEHVIVPLSELKGAGEAHAADRATVFLKETSEGKKDPRRPPSVRQEEDGSLTVLDGRSGTSAALALGYKYIPVRVIDSVRDSKTGDVHKLKDPEAQATLEVMYQDAARHKDKFDKKVEQLADEFSGFPLTTVLKGRRKTTAKIETDYSGDPTRMKDILRATLVLGSAKDAEAAKSRIMEIFQVDDDVRDLFENDVWDNQYQDQKFTVVMDGRRYELQVNTLEMIIAKEVYGHILYDEQVKLDQASMKGEVEQSEYESKSKVLTDAQARIYGEAKKAHREGTPLNHFESLLHDIANDAVEVVNRQLGLEINFSNRSRETSAPFLNALAELYGSGGFRSYRSPPPGIPGATATGMPSTFKKRASSGKSTISSTSDSILHQTETRGQSVLQPVDTQSQEFKDWFGQGAVEEKGKPKKVFHSTSEDFESFDTTKERPGFGSTRMGAHFGTTQAANLRAGNNALNDMIVRGQFQPNNYQVLPVYLNLQNPLRVPDMASLYRDPNTGEIVEFEEAEARDITEEYPLQWEEAEDVSEYLLDQGVFDIDQFEETRGDFEAIRSLLESMGYDGIVYANEVEGNGEDSYIAFRPNQVKSAVSNTGQFDAGSDSILEQQEEVSGPRGGYQPITNGHIIRLFQTSDPSTFMHEAGHLFLQLELTTGTQEEIDRILAWLEADSVDDVLVRPRESISPEKRARHEKWARTFEAYLLDGKAPSPELRDTFSRMKAWLLGVYKSMRGFLERYGVEVDDNIREIFDRMLATEEQIANAQIQNQYAQPLFESAESAGMTASEYQDYLDRQARTREKSNETLFSKLYKELKKRVSQEWDDDYKNEVEEVTDRLKEEPVHAARIFLRGPKTEGHSNRLNTEEVKKVFDGKIPKQLKGMTHRDSAINPDNAAGQFGYKNGVEFLEALVNEPTLKEAAADEATANLKERYGDMLNDGTLMDEAQQAVHNEEMGRLILLELRALNRKTGGNAINRQALKERARQTIAGMPINQLRPDRYHRAEVRAATEAGKAMKAGDAESARKFKLQQATNFYLWKAASEARTKAESMRTQLAKIRRSKMVKVHPDFRVQVKAYLEAYEFRKTSPEERARAMEKLAYLASWINKQTTDTFEIQVYDKNVDALRSVGEEGTFGVDIKNYREMTLEELEGVYNMARHLRFVGGRLADAEKAAKRERHARLAQVLLDNFKDKKKPPHGSKMEKFMRGLKGYGANVLLHADSLLRYLDGWKDGGAWQKAIKRPIDDAITKVLIPMQEKAGTEIDEIYHRFYDDKELTEMNREKNIAGRMMTKWQMISLALNWGNEGNRQALLKSIREGEQEWSTDQIAEVLGVLSKKDWDFVQSVWDYIETYRDQLFEVDRRRNGVPPRAIEPTPVETKYGTYRGGYYHLKYDPQESWRVTEEEASQMIKAVTLGRFAKPHTPDGALKERVGSGGRPVWLDIGVFHQQINDAISVIALAEPITEVQEVLSSKEVREAMSATGNLEILRGLDMWLKDTAAQEIISGDLVSKTFRHIRTGFSASKLGWNVGTIIMQVFGVLQSMPVIGYGNMMKGILLLGRNPVGKNSIIAQVQAKSNFMAERSGTFNKDIRDTLDKMKGNPDSPGHWPPWMRDSMFAGIVYMQRYVDVATWLGAYEKYKNDNPGASEDDIIHYADRAVARSQASGIWSDRTPIERGTVAPNLRQAEAIRVFTTLGSYFFAKGNVAVELTSKTNFKDPKQAFQYVVDMMVLFAVETFLVAALRGMIPDDDDESKALWASKEVMVSLLTAFPFLREFGSEMQGFRGGSTLAQFYKEVGEASTQVGQAEMDMPLFKAINDVGGIVFKYPSSAINRVVESTVKDIQGEEVHPLDYLMYRKKDED